MSPDGWRTAAQFDYDSTVPVPLPRILMLSCAACLVAAAQDSRTVLDNNQVKVLDVVVQPHQKTKLHEHTVNRVMVYLQPGRQDLNYQGGKKVVLDWKA